MSLASLGKRPSASWLLATTINNLILHGFCGFYLFMILFRVFAHNWEFIFIFLFLFLLCFLIYVPVIIKKFNFFMKLRQICVGLERNMNKLSGECVKQNDNFFIKLTMKKLYTFPLYFSFFGVSRIYNITT